MEKAGVFTTHKKKKHRTRRGFSDRTSQQTRKRWGVIQLKFSGNGGANG